MKLYDHSEDLGEIIKSPTLLPKWTQSSTEDQQKRMMFTVDQQLWQRIQHWQRKRNIPFHTFFISVWAVLLWRYSDSDDLLFVVKWKNKDQIPIQIQIDHKTTFVDVVRQVERNVDEDRKDSFEIDTAFTLDHRLQIFEEKADSCELKHEDVPFCLSARRGEEFNMDIVYSTRFFSDYGVHQTFIHLQNIMNQVIYRTFLRLKDIYILSPEERHRIVHAFNQTYFQLPKEKTVDQLFIEQAKKNAQKTAIVTNQGALTYQELHEKSNQLAHYLMNQGVRHQQIVGLLVRPSPWMIIGMLGILKAGAAYLPIDPQYPLQRINYLLNDSKVSLLLAESGLAIPQAYKGTNIEIDQIAYTQQPSHTPPKVHNGNDPVYVVYTSGSTGYPKGVVVEHGALLNLVTWHNAYYQITSADRSTKYAGWGFDASVWEIFPYLVAGATIYIVPEELRIDVEELHRYIEQHRITCSFLPTPIAEQFMKQDNRSLRLLLTGGEQLRQVQQRSYQIANNYGPTENTVVTTSGFVRADDQPISIGKPIANNQVYIFNRYNQLQPIGVPGELCVSGESLARGYLYQPELTNQKFVEHPLFPEKRMYRTGDLARWLPDGQIEFLGRKDQQVKIRGIRIELGEIEATLMRHAKVKEAAVTVYEEEQKEKMLCAYIVKADSGCSIAELRSYLEKELPAYMIPAHWMMVERIPLTPHGKVDKQALPLPTRLPSDPFDPKSLSFLQKRLYQLWREVLGKSPSTPNEHFFHAGGHSLKAMRLISRIRKEFGIKVTWSELFAHPTFQALASFIENGQTEQSDPIHPAAEQEYYPVSPVQHQLLALEQTKELGTTYHIPVVWLIKGKFDLSRLYPSIQGLIDRHEAFRTTFHLIQGKLVQQIHDKIDWRIERFQVKDEHEAKKQVAEFIRPFHVMGGPLFRIGLIRISEDKHVFILDMHHLICDGVSTAILYREFARLYRGETLPRLSYQYKDYVVWQQKQLGTNQWQEDEAFWLNQFSEEIPKSELPTDFGRPAQQRFRGKKIRYAFDPELTALCQRFSHQQNTTLYMTLLSVYSILLAKITGQESMIIGSAVAGRSRSEWESVFGMFVNTLPILTHPRKNRSFDDFLNHIKEQVLSTQEHGSYPLIELVEKLGIHWDHRRNPFFDTAFVMQNIEIPEIQLPGLQIEKFSYEESHSMFDLTWEFVENDTLELSIAFNADLFREQTIQRMIHQYIHLLKQVLAQPHKRIAEFELVTQEEKEQILTVFNQRTRVELNHQSVLELFAEQVQRNPNQVAIVDGDASISYQELDYESNQLAHLLRRKGISSEKIVSVVAESSIEFLISMMAILKTGGVFLPIDPTYPSNRIQYMLEDSHASVVLVQKGVKLPEQYSGEVLGLDRNLWRQESADDFEGEILASQLAYVIYTSGSTGKPKGVMIEHGSLLNLVVWHHRYYQITAQDRCTKYAGVGFDASIWEIFPYLTKGSTIYLVDPKIRHDLVALNQFFEKNKITVSFLPTAIAESFMELKNSSLRLLLVGGDTLKRVRPQTYTIVNNYGPTENTVVTTCYTVDAYHHEVIPIGRPIQNHQVYILNQESQLQPIGVPGELCISGSGLARGYLHRPQLTKEKFLPNPFDKKERMYRTGDLARWLPDGNIEFLGRIDDQVQIRGYRIELGEIESILIKHPNVREAIVLMQKEDDSSEGILCAYIIGDREHLENECRMYLQQELPDYMIPTYLIQLDAFPLTANGKIDRKALPKPTRDIASDTSYKPPADPIQQLLAEIWGEVLQHPKIGIDDNFFSLGGDSIKAIQVAARLQQHQKKIAVHHLFRYPTIAELSAYVENQSTPVEPKHLTGEVPLTPIQTYFFKQKFSDQHHWNQAVMIPNQKPWNRRAVEQAFHQLVLHHDVLRMRYPKKNGTVKQIIGGITGTYFTLDMFHFVGENNVEKKIQIETNRLQRSFHLDQGPLVRLAIFETGETHQLFIVIHHLLIDGVSWRILLDDFFRLYQGWLLGEKISLPPKTTSYQLWSKKLLDYANSPKLLDEVSYWKNIEQTNVQPLFHMKDHGKLKDTDSIECCLTQEQTQLLLKNAHRAYRTEMNDLLLAALCIAVKEWAHVDRMAIFLEGHGREPIFDDVDLSRTIGWFTSVYPVLFDLSPTSLPFMIKSVKETLRSIPNKGIGYGILRYLTAPQKREGLRFSLHPEIRFNYLGQFSEDVQFAGMGSVSNLLGEPFSPNSRVHPLEIYAAVLDDQLRFQFLFQQNACERMKMQQFIEGYHHFLLQILDHCVNKKESTLTPSDLSASDVSLEELDQFLESLD